MKIVDSINWSHVHGSLNEKGFATVPAFFSKEECSNLASLYLQSKLYRSVINMKRHRFGEGEYKYFAYPLPAVVQNVRQHIYAHLTPLANEWMQQLGLDTSFPAEHPTLIKRCHQYGQTRPTPLILKYEKGGYNTLHQDLYGEVYFPLQVVFLLSEPKKDFEGGEFVMIEQLPRAQSKATVINLQMGDALIFATNFRPVVGTRGYYRAKVKHGVSPLISGTRHALGIIFHDAN
ncbi:MAG: 2OG-Fe(II) oxygenase [Flammeovirgaceae bacterium]